jgi:hypothetical protein
MKSRVSEAAATPMSVKDKLELANRLYREYHTRCFWHMKPDLVVSEAILPAIILGLRTHGGKEGALAAARLL